MQVRHNTKLLEAMMHTAVDNMAAKAKANAETHAMVLDEAKNASNRLNKKADFKWFCAHGIRAIMFAIAGAIAFIALAHGIQILNQKPAPIRTSYSSPAPAPTDTTANQVVTTNYSVFRDVDVTVSNGETVSVHAGHAFENEDDDVFTDAWCYSGVWKNGVQIAIDLGSKSPNGSITGGTVSQTTKEQSGLTDNDIAAMQAACPWLDGNPDKVE